MDIYLDTSAFLAVYFDEPGAEAVRLAIRDAQAAYSSNLLEAEAASAIHRRRLDSAALGPRLARLRWVHPDRPLTREIKAVLEKGPALRGADLWHLACALYLAQDPAHLAFITLDGEQADAAAKIGFKVLPDGRRGGFHEDRAPYRAGGLRRKRPRLAVNSGA